MLTWLGMKGGNGAAEAPSWSSRCVTIAVALTLWLGMWLLLRWLIPAEYIEDPIVGILPGAVGGLLALVFTMVVGWYRLEKRYAGNA